MLKNIFFRLKVFNLPSPPSLFQIFCQVNNAMANFFLQYLNLPKSDLKFLKFNLMLNCI